MNAKMASLESARLFVRRRSMLKGAMIPSAGNPLNRLSVKRGDAAFLAARLADPATRLLPLSHHRPLMTGIDAPRLRFLSPSETGPISAAAAIFLGMSGDVAYFAFDTAFLGEGGEARLIALGRFADVRAAAPLMAADELAVAFQAKAMTEWHESACFCGRCGAVTRPGAGGSKRDCPACGAELFPRLDPAVIMLVTDGERALLARNVKWPPDFFSTLAGFVEPGETFEAAVRREVAEEVGVRVGAVRYFASQPWPFPAALMVGFIAACAGEAPHVDGGEIAEARWFARSEARALLDGKMPGRRGPSPAAIAWHLIDAWAKEV